MQGRMREVGVDLFTDDGRHFRGAFLGDWKAIEWEEVEDDDSAIVLQTEALSGSSLDT